MLVGAVNTAGAVGGCGKGWNTFVAEVEFELAGSAMSLITVLPSSVRSR